MQTVLTAIKTSIERNGIFLKNVLIKWFRVNLFIYFLTSNQLIFQEHLNQEHPNVDCEFCGEKFNSTIGLDEHKQKDCTKITVPCTHKDYGCSEWVSW